ncbi:hypothetical protein STEG23_032267, partial [Scotinomys teguina]
TDFFTNVRDNGDEREDADDGDNGDDGDDRNGDDRYGDRETEIETERVEREEKEEATMEIEKKTDRERDKLETEEMEMEETEKETEERRRKMKRRTDSATNLRGQTQGPGLTNSAASHIYILGLELAYTNIYPIYDLLECEKGLWQFEEEISTNNNEEPIIPVQYTLHAYRPDFRIRLLTVRADGSCKRENLPTRGRTSAGDSNRAAGDLSCLQMANKFIVERSQVKQIKVDCGGFEMAIQDIATYFSEEEWAKLTKWQKSAYVYMKRNYLRMTSPRYPAADAHQCLRLCQVRKADELAAGRGPVSQRPTRPPKPLGLLPIQSGSPASGAVFMGHLLSKEPRNRPSQKRPRCCSWCRRRRPLIRLPSRTPAKASPQSASPRNRDCFFRGPCMLCFIVHSPSGPAPAGPEEEPPLSPQPLRDRAYAAPLQHLEPHYSALAPEDCAAAARRFLLSSAAAAAAASSSASSPATRCKELGLAAAAAWEQQGRSLFLASMGPLRFLGPPAAAELFQALPSQAEYPIPPEIVCKRKGVGNPDCAFCKQPRCGGAGAGCGGGGPVGGGASLMQQLDAGCCQAQEQLLPPLGSRPASPASECDLFEDAGDAFRAGGIAHWSVQQPEGRDADYQKTPENPCDCLREPLPETLDINQLPGSIVLEVDLDD